MPSAAPPAASPPPTASIAPSSLPQPLPSTHWPAVLAALACGIAISVLVGKVPLALGALRAELGLSLVQFGWVSSVLTTLAVLFALPVGLLAGRIGALRMVLAGLVLGAVGALAALPVHGIGGLLASRLVEGAAFLMVAVATPSLITAATAPAQRRLALSLWSTYMPLGVSVGLIGGAALIARAGWRALWLLSAVGLLAAALGLLLQRRHYAALRPAAGPSADSLRQTLQVLRQPLPWLLPAAFGAWALQHFALIVWMPAFMREQRGLDSASVAALTSLMLLVNIPGGLLGGVLMSRGVPRGPLIAVTHTLTGLLGLLAAADGLPDGLRYAACLAMSMIGGLVPAAVFSSSAVLARTPAQVAAVQGLILQGSQFGQFIGTPLIAAVVASAGHWSAARLVTASAAALGVLVGLCCHRLERRQAAAAAAATALARAA
ncbi:MAG: hypothetical protein RL223_4871 [Pseudomonadota bacterium]